MLVLNCTFFYLFLDYEKTWEKASEEPNNEEVYYEEPNLFGCIEGENYGIVFGAEDEDIDREA
jgi:hypothetical protein